ncbi:MAG: ABC transporter permease [Anaerolineae bacterium]|nr:ABC transporter permease [Anaerolineae bacterium]
MARFVLRRLGFIIVVSLGIVFFSFFGMRMASNSTSSSPSYDPIPPARYAVQETVRYMRNLSHGDLGTMLIRRGRRGIQTAVGDIIADTYPKSMGLLLIALFVAAAIGLPIGVSAAVHQRSALSLGTMTLTLLGVSLPSFSVAALLQIAEIYWYRSFGFRLVPVGGFGWDAHLVIPTLVLAARPLAYLARIAYMAFSEILDQDYIRTAHSKGLYQSRVMQDHAYPNAAVPILTGLGVSLRFSLGSLPVVEYFLGWPGIGAALLDAIRNRQDVGVAGMALVLGVTFMLINLLLDVLYRYVDPRLKEQAI